MEQPQQGAGQEEKREWPELKGKTFKEAKDVIEAYDSTLKVYKVPEGSMVTMDYDLGRVRVYVNEADVVVSTPRRG